MTEKPLPDPKPSEPERIDDRSPQIRAVDLATRIISSCLTAVFPPAAGFWIDGKLGTAPLLLILGLVFGLTAGFYQFRAVLEFVAREDSK